MPITDQQALEWLDSDLQYRNIIVQVSCQINGVESTLYLTQKTYGNYDACLLPGFNYNESLALTGTPTLSIGTMKLDNTNGARDAWIDYIWTNRRILVLGGDVRWAVSDYRVILDGITNSLSSDAENTLTLIIQDKLQRLNTPITEVVLGGTSNNKNAIIPFTLGECSNITPLLVDPIGPTGTGLYRYHPQPAQGVIEARAGMFPISIVEQPNDATFYPVYAPKGTVTCSVWGHLVFGTNTYSDNIGVLIKQLATIAGKPETHFTNADIDLTQVDAFSAAHPQAVGYYGNSQDNILSCMQGLAASVGAQVVCSKEGLLRILTLELSTPVKVVTEFDIEPKSLTFTTVGTATNNNGFDVKAGVVLGYDKNWTVQDYNAEAAIPKEHQDLFQQEWRKVTVKDVATEAKYKLHVTPTQEDTYLLSYDDALAEANRRLAFWNHQRKVYTFKGRASCLFLNLGQTVTLKFDRFGLSAGVDGVVISLSFDWFSYSVTVGVLV